MLYTPSAESSTVSKSLQAKLGRLVARLLSPDWTMPKKPERFDILTRRSNFLCYYLANQALSGSGTGPL